jgi:hypothetical protein
MNDEEWEADSGFLRGLRHFHLEAVGEGLLAGVGVDGWSEKVGQVGLVVHGVSG